MVLWRISRHRDLSGIGGLKAAGRWHHPGHAIVYMTETPASSLLEVCVHTSANDVPPAFTLLKIEGPDIEVPLHQSRRSAEELAGATGNDARFRHRLARKERERAAQGAECDLCSIHPTS